MKNYEYVSLSYANDLNRIQIPKYQRGLVWTSAKKKALIETLHREFPIGVLLVAPDNDGDKTLQLLDGQQRLATIREYEKNKYAYWMKLNEESVNAILEKINGIIGDHGPSVSQAKFAQLLNPDYDLADWTDSLDDIEKPVLKQLRDIVKDEGRAECEKYIDLTRLQLPVIKFLGSPNDLPQVFENLNQGGTPLTKYEVFNAAWVNHMVTLPTSAVGDELLKEVKNYYLSMQKNGQFDVSGFSEDELTSTREVNMAEFARALGTYVVAGVPALLNESQTDEIGFGLLGIMGGVDNKRIAELPTRVAEIQKNLVETLDEKVGKITKSLQTTFEKLTVQRLAYSTRRNAKKTEYATGLSSSFKVLSYFASLWDADDATFQKALNNLPSYYVFDALAGTWSGHGDQRLTDYYPSVRSRSYKEPIHPEKFHQVFNNWLEDKPRIQKTFSKDIQALITMHANLTYFANNFSNGEDFEFEHIIPKNRILAADTKPAFVHCGALGNGMLLRKSDNNIKKDKTIYEAGLEDQYADVIATSAYPTKADFALIFQALDDKAFDKVNAFIDNRSLKVADTLINALLQQ